MSRSLVARLAALAAILILLALTLAGLGLATIFDRELERRAEVELMQIVKALAGQISLNRDGQPAADLSLPDPRFAEPYSGLYWQVKADKARPLRSRSLWDFELAVPAEGPSGERRVVDLAGPNGGRLIAVTQTITVSRGEADGVVQDAAVQDVPVQVTAALDRQDLVSAQRSFRNLLVPSLAALGLCLALAMWLFLRLALRPFQGLAKGLQMVHQGQARALPGIYPVEVQPVVDDLNRLIAFWDAATEKARARASDLAHGLKTPLAVLAALSRQAKGEGRAELSGAIDEQTALMQQQVNRALAHARAGLGLALGKTPTPVAPLAEKLVSALRRLPAEKSLLWDVAIAPGAVFVGDDADFMEMIGNVLDNARKWAATRIGFDARMTAGATVFTVQDDGPGLTREQAAQIERGRRWDESTPGTGFGLAITRDLVESYGGTLTLDPAPSGGLRVTLSIPAR